jgi:hypothetical protein
MERKKTVSGRKEYTIVNVKVAFSSFYPTFPLPPEIPFQRAICEFNTDEIRGIPPRYRKSTVFTKAAARSVLL